MTQFLSKIRSNLALIVAFFSLCATAGGWYSSYHLISYRVDQLEVRANVNRSLIDKTKEDLNNHLSSVNVHMDERTWKILNTRIDEIHEQLVIITKQLMISRFGKGNVDESRTNTGLLGRH